MLTPKPLKITCADGVPLAALLIEPIQSPIAAVPINGGTGFTKEFYLPFAQYLAENGFATVVFDYRGTRESAPANMRHCDYTFLDYGQKDMPAVLDFMDARYPTLPKLVFGHSVGGQQIGFMPNHAKIKGLVTYASSVGYTGFMPLLYRLKTWYFFNIVTPLSIALTGYVKAKRLNIMEDLPRQVVLDWRNWCAVPEYFFNEKYYGKTVPKAHFQDLNFPIHIYWAEDDPIANKEAVAMFWKHVKSSKGIDIQRLVPIEWGLDKLDHYGFFRRQCRENLWVEAVQKLNSFLN
jgi:predicted alpha/beta hydrolase